MKKNLILLAIFFIPLLSVKAETLMGFMDGQLYDETGKLRYICFLDGSCIDKDNNQTTRSALGLSVLPEIQISPGSQSSIPTQYVYVPVYVTNPNQLTTTPINGISEPSTIINQPTTMPEFTPFSGTPYKIKDAYNINGNYYEYTYGINLSQEFKQPDNHNKIFRGFCVTPAYPDGVHSESIPGVTNGIIDYTKRTATLIIHDDSSSAAPAEKSGHYACKFKFVLPEGTFESAPIEFDLD